MLNQVAGLGPICSDFDLYLIDQFGVLHNGVEPYPHAIKTLEELRARDKRVVIISNSGKRSANNVRRIAGLGFGEHLFDHFVTSGEVAFGFLKKRLENETIQTCFLISRDNDSSAVAELGIRQVDSPDDADLIVISGCESELYSEDDYRKLLRKPALRNTSCICTNPDKLMLTTGGLRFGAGRIAEIYEELGGTVHWIGKPFPLIYQYILDLFSDCVNSRTLCIGDSLEHDIAGGQALGLNTLLVRTGILTNVTDEQLQLQSVKYNVSPNYLAEELRF